MDELQKQQRTKLALITPPPHNKFYKTSCRFHQHLFQSVRCFRIYKYENCDPSSKQICTPAIPYPVKKGLTQIGSVLPSNPMITTENRLLLMKVFLFRMGKVVKHYCINRAV